MSTIVSEIGSLLGGEDLTIPVWTAAKLLGAVIAVYVVGIATYRLTFHPLAKFPGPFLCRVSYWQQCYYEAICNGRFSERLPEYHRKYGE